MWCPAAYWKPKYSRDHKNTIWVCYEIFKVTIDFVTHKELVDMDSGRKKNSVKNDFTVLHRSSVIESLCSIQSSFLYCLGNNLSCEMLYISQKYCLNWSQYLGVSWFSCLDAVCNVQNHSQSSVFMLCIWKYTF